jgi:hypothetical protein
MYMNNKKKILSHKGMKKSGWQSVTKATKAKKVK